MRTEWLQCGAFRSGHRKKRRESKQGVREERREQQENKQRQEEEGSVDCQRKDRGKKE